VCWTESSAWQEIQETEPQVPHSRRWGESEGIMKKNSIALVICALPLLMLMTGRQIEAQNLYGSIRGVVKDQSGAVIPGATVTATNTQTGISRQAASESDGSFEFLNLLAPATYNVAVAKNGFEKFASSSINLNVNQI
jgi:hypothetical protein